MSLADWCKNGWLRKHKTSNREIADLLHVADRDLADCEAEGLSADWKLNIAYNAALQLSTSALAAAGYRSEGTAHHYRVIQSLAFTVGADPRFVRQLDQFRKKRNVGAYERAGAVSDQEANEMHQLAKQLRKNVSAWLRKNYPHLLS